MVVTRKKRRVLYGPAVLWKRLVAFTIDLLVLEFFVFSQFESVLRTIMPSGPLASDDLAAISLAMGAIGFLVFLYFTVLEYAFGQTLGDMAVAIRLVSLSGPSFWRIAVSNIIFFPFFPVIILWVIEPLMVLISGTHQRFMHQLLGLQVVEEYAFGGI